MGNTTNENIKSIVVINGVDIDFIVFYAVAWPAVNVYVLACVVHDFNHATLPPQPASRFKNGVIDITLSK